MYLLLFRSPLLSFESRSFHKCRGRDTINEPAMLIHELTQFMQSFAYYVSLVLRHLAAIELTQPKSIKLPFVFSLLYQIT